MRSMTVYDRFETDKIYQFKDEYTLDLFKRRTFHMSNMANHVGLNPFRVTRVIKQSNPDEVHLQYQVKQHGSIRSAFVEQNAIAFLNRVKLDFVEGQEYRSMPFNKDDILQSFGQGFWEHVGVNIFRIESICVVPNPDAPESLRLIAVRNRSHDIKRFSMNINDADLFTSISGFSFNLEKKVDTESSPAIVKSIELMPITNEAQRIEAIKLLEGIRYDS